jgi:hypothetical protein
MLHQYYSSYSSCILYTVQIANSLPYHVVGTYSYVVPVVVLIIESMMSVVDAKFYEV